MKAIHYIYLSVGTGALGVVLTFVVLFFCRYYEIDISRHTWILAVPISLSLLVNVIFIEVFRKWRAK
jgi:hypothetical protein